MLIKKINNPKPTPARLADIPNGKMGVKATLKLMSKMITANKTNMAVRNKAIFLTGRLASKDWKAEAEAIFYYVRDDIRYVRDVHGVETLAEPQYTMSIGAGDCDDKVILAGSLLQSIGHPVRLVAVGFHNRPFSHVFIETLLGRQWVPMELTVALPFGVAPKGITSVMYYHINLGR